MSATLNQQSSLQRSRVRRREFLQAGTLGALSLTTLRGTPEPKKRANSCILLMLVGGPSQLDTWDMKPDAPSTIRSPFRPIKTNVAGIEISEIFPRMAKHAEKYALLRGVHHSAAPVHDTGHQLMQTGRLFHDRVEYPSIGCVLGKLRNSPSHFVLPHPIGDTDGDMLHGEGAGFLGSVHDPHHLSIAQSAAELRNESEATRRRYGLNDFGRNCLLARRLVEAGVGFITVNMFDTVFNQTTWDIHGSVPFSSIGGYRDVVGPMFDMAYSSLLQDLHDRGLLDTTMVVAAGEFGRTPRFNPAGGRDHWTECWTILMSGGGIRGGQIVGASDRIAAEPRDRAVSPAEVAATIYTGFGINPATTLNDAHGRSTALVEAGAKPVRELFA